MGGIWMKGFVYCGQSPYSRAASVSGILRTSPRGAEAGGAKLGRRLRQRRPQYFLVDPSTTSLIWLDMVTMAR